MIESKVYNSNNLKKINDINKHVLTVKKGVTYIDNILIVNKTYSLPSTYNPGSINKDVMEAFYDMYIDAKSLGIALYVVSGFRTYDIQNILYYNYLKKDSKEKVDTYSARPGHSEHQSGLALDLNLANINFDNTIESKWLNDNCYRFGFILRYPKDKIKETGYIYEPWHYRYVGKALAYKLYNNGNWITLEEYYGITSNYNY